MTKFVTNYKIPLAVALLAVAGYLLYRHLQKPKGDPELGGEAVSPYASNAPRALGSSSILVAPPYSGAGGPAAGQQEPPSDPVQVGEQTFAAEGAGPPPPFNDQGELTAEYVEYISGATVAPAGTTTTFQGETYDVSGTPEFSSGNFNPNSPAGVLAMNAAMAAAGMSGTQAGGSAIAPAPPQPDLYTADNAAQNEAVATFKQTPRGTMAFF